MATSTIFNGTSRFSQDFQQVIQRALSIAQLPNTQLQQQQARLQDKVTALDGLEKKFTAIGAALDGISNAAGAGALGVSSSLSSIATASLTGNPAPSTYAVQVTNLGSFSTSLSGVTLPKVTDPTTQGLTTAATLTLTVNGTATSIQPADGSLNSLVSAINSANLGAEASLMNVGPPSAPDYRLYLRSSSLGPVTISLNDGTNSLADSISTGTLAVYSVNGLPSGGISTTSRTVTLAPGLTANLQAVGTTEISVNRSSNELKTTLSAFVTAFNDTVDELNLHRGKSGGALAGDTVINTLTGALKNLTGYTSTSTPGLSSLADLGVVVDQTGKLTFDSTTVDSLSSAGLQNAAAFLGTPSTGGFLKAAADALSNVDNTTDGVIHSSTSSINSAINQEQDRIDANNRRLTDLQTSLSARMAAADALIAAMEQQVNFFTSLYDAMRTQNGN